ncbi:hypothetical protein ACVW1A_006813 [Bradyrhizobium sp. LB1.3]
MRRRRQSLRSTASPLISRIVGRPLRNCQPYLRSRVAQPERRRKAVTVSRGSGISRATSRPGMTRCRTGLRARRCGRRGLAMEWTHILNCRCARFGKTPVASGHGERDNWYPPIPIAWAQARRGARHARASRSSCPYRPRIARRGAGNRHRQPRRQRYMAPILDRTESQRRMVLSGSQHAPNPHGFPPRCYSPLGVCVVVGALRHPRCGFVVGGIGQDGYFPEINSQERANRQIAIVAP